MVGGVDEGFHAVCIVGVGMIETSDEKRAASLQLNLAPQDFTVRRQLGLFR